MAAPVSAQKADTVVLHNGDRMVGEIKSLDHGALTYKTDDIGTLTIKWDKVHSLISRQYFEVETVTGERYYGALQPASEAGRIVVAVTPFIDTLDVLDVVRISPIGRSFWARIDGKVNFALGFQRANELRNIGVDFEARYRTRVRLTRLQGSSYFQAQESAEATSRNSISLNQQRFLQRRWMLQALGQIEQNEELNLAMRGLIGGGGGRFLIQDNRWEVLALGGLAYTDERFTGSSATSNVELIVSGQTTYFRRDFPKADLQATVNVFPNLTDLGRVRIDLDLSTSYEFIRDLRTGLTFFDRFDSRPPTAEAEGHDYGLSLTAGWVF